MSFDRTGFYDDSEKTLWIPREVALFIRLPKEEVFHWATALKEGITTDDGRPIAKVNYLFRSQETAAYNYQPLAFVGVGVYYEDGGNRIEYTPESGPLEVDVREDFGISHDKDS
ncbi:MAG: hypothetical protein AUK47_23290 [Deltaproteobacteria bacterium CG2_30_63_29]|nr:MAG: hypothetical protein AUK47_23290 [Deltaproteobacteria bacterium CG2_30_63_29]PJB36930.1 MAG: hypothetical protein CO108_22165 [Deltaproteobacteria bacterium CG_4_9_14_3_um_filter_63_12]